MLLGVLLGAVGTVAGAWGYLVLAARYWWEPFRPEFLKHNGR